MQSAIREALQKAKGGLRLSDLRDRVMEDKLFRGRDKLALYNQIAGALKVMPDVVKTADKSYTLGPVASGTKAAATKAAPAKSASATKAAPATKAASTKASASPALAVREDESPWTAAELREVRGELELEIGRLVYQISEAEEGIADLLRDSGDGAGDDQADAGTKTFEREHEMSLANNARELLLQNERALQRLEDGTYGVCERCGKPIGKLRLQAFPRATLCVACKQLEERR